MQTNEMPSMDNIYNSKYYKQTRDYEQNLSDEYYKKAQMPFKTGVIPHYLDGSDVNFNVIKSLSGNDIDIKNFTHGNMQPFLTKGITQNVEQFGLNKNMGYSTDLKIKKEAIKRDDFFSNVPYYNDPMVDKTKFLIARTNLSEIQNNISPIQTVRVGPGLNKGYTSEATGGFQQADTMSYVKPRTKDELRPLSDQRNSIYTLPLKPKNNVEKRGVVMPLAKNRADRSFYQDENNWFKGQSVLKKDTERPIENLKEELKKQDSHVDYYGSLKYQNEFISKNDDYGKNTIIIYDNERNLTQKETPVANFSSIVKAMVAPITDAIKITLKEYLIDNPRINGNAAPQLPEKPTLYDPDNHIMKTTIKETTIHEGNNGILTGSAETYSALYDTAKTTTKETTIHEGNNGVLTGADGTYSSLYDTAKTTTKETTIHEGNNGVLTGIDETYSALYDTARITTKETTIHEGNNGNLSGIDETYSALYDTARITTKETTIHEGNNGNLTGADETYSALYDTAKTTTKETLLHETNGGFIEGKQKGYINEGNNFRRTLRETLPKQDTTRNINNVSYHSTYVYDPSIVAKTTVKETTVGLGGSKYGFLGGVLNGLFGGYLIKDEKAKNTQRQFSLTENYGIVAGSQTQFSQTDREADYNAEIDGTRELIMIKAGHTPNGAGKFVGLPKENVNMVINKKQIDLEEAERIGHMGLIKENTPIPLTLENITKEPYKPNAYNNRLDSSILSTLVDNDNIIKINPIRMDCDAV
jgi:hypothetical protein